MWLQLFLFLFAFIISQYYKNLGENAKNRHKLIVFFTVLLVLQSAMRSFSVGSDTESYISDFEYTRDFLSWDWVFHNFYDVYVLGEGKDAGFHLIMKMFSTIIPSPRLWLFFIAIFFFIPFCHLAEKELKNIPQIFMFFVLYQTMYYSFFSITGIRQTIATVATFWGIYLIRKNRIIPFVIIIVLAASVHKSVLLFLPFFFIGKFPKSKLLLIISIVGLPIIMGMSRVLALYLTSFSISEQYTHYTESDMQAEAANFLIFFVCAAILTLYSKYKSPKGVDDIWVNACALAIFFTPLAWVDTSLMRVIQYFAIFSMISIPIAIDNLGGKNISRIVYWVLFFALLVTTIRHNYEYTFFFWE